MSSSSSSDPVPPVLLLLGAEAALRDAALAGIRERVLAGATPEFNEDRFDLASSAISGARIIAAARTLPVGAPGRLVRVRGLEDRRAARFIEAELLPYLEDPVHTTCLVLEAVKVDRRKPWVKRVVCVGEVVDCAGPSHPAELRAWIEARIRERSKRVARGTAAALLESVGPDLDRLASEVDKLSLYVGQRASVTPEDVAEVTCELRPRALYELTDALGQRRLGPSLTILTRLLDQGEAPLAVLAGLANHFRRLLRARDCRPFEAQQVQRTLAVRPYAARKLVEQARQFDSRRLRGALETIRRTDEALKGAVALSPRLAIERLVLNVCA